MSGYWLHLIIPNIAAGMLSAYIEFFIQEKSVKDMGSIERFFFFIFASMICTFLWPFYLYDVLSRTVMRPLCQTCRKAPAVFDCSGTGEIPARLAHKRHLVCKECDRGGGCFMLKGDYLQYKS